MDKKRPGYIYGEDKNYYQEADDSIRMLGIVLLVVFFAFAFFLGLAVGAAIL